MLTSHDLPRSHRMFTCILTILYCMDTTEAGYAYIGCFKDEANHTRNDPSPASGASSHTLHQCASTCAPYTYFAIQSASQCFCKSTLSKAIQYGASNNCVDGTGGTLANDLYVNCDIALSICASNITQSSVLTDTFGGSGGLWNTALNQGRVYSFQNWGYGNRSEGYEGLHIRDWYAENKTTAAVDVFGYGDTHIPCEPFTLLTDDFITGYTIWTLSSNERPGRLALYTRNNYSYTCGIPSFDLSTATSVWTDSFEYDQNHFWYLSGFNIKSGAQIDKLGFQFTRAIITQSPTQLPTPLPTNIPTSLPNISPAFSPTTNLLVPTALPSVNPTEYPTSSPTNYPSDAPTNIPTDLLTYFSSTSTQSDSSTLMTNSITTLPLDMEAQEAVLYLFGIPSPVLIRILVVMVAVTACIIVCCCVCCIYFEKKRRKQEKLQNAMEMQKIDMACAQGSKGKQKQEMIVMMESDHEDSNSVCRSADMQMIMIRKGTREEGQAGTPPKPSRKILKSNKHLKVRSTPDDPDHNDTREDSHELSFSSSSDHNTSSVKYKLPKYVDKVTPSGWL
eukprot:342106_1